MALSHHLIIILFFSLFASDIVRDETHSSLARGLGMHVIVTTSSGDKAEQKRFDLQLTLITLEARAFSEPSELE